MIVDPNLKSSAITNYKGCEINIVTDINDVTYFKRAHVARALGLTRQGFLEFVKSKIGKPCSVVFVVKCSDSSWNPTGFLSKDDLTDVLSRRKGSDARLLLAWVENFTKGAGE